MSQASDSLINKRFREVTSVYSYILHLIFLGKLFLVYLVQVGLKTLNVVIKGRQPFRTLWVCSLQTLPRLHSAFKVTQGFKRLVAHAKCNRDPCESVVRSSFFLSICFFLSYLNYIVHFNVLLKSLLQDSLRTTPHLRWGGVLNQPVRCGMLHIGCMLESAQRAYLHNQGSPSVLIYLFSFSPCLLSVSEH